VSKIVRVALGGSGLDRHVRRDELSAGQIEVLLHVYNNVSLWATNGNQLMFNAIGLGEQRQDWARLLGIDDQLSDADIQEMLGKLTADKQRSGLGTVDEISLCRVGTPAFLPHLRSYTTLRILDLANTSLGDEDMVEVASFVDLRMLRLNSVAITDAGVQHLVALRNLEELYLPNTHVTDKCFDSLSLLPNLKYVSLAQTAVTADGARQFMEANTRCRISR
jgi:hypothetical protein